MSNFAFDNKTSIFELAVEPQSKVLDLYPSAREVAQGKLILPVPDYQIKSTIQKLQRLGVKILDIYTITDPKYQQFMTEEKKTALEDQSSSLTETSPTEITPSPETIAQLKEITPAEPEPPRETEVKIIFREPAPEITPKEQYIPSDQPWWVEIFTQEPRCLYYFGPFDSEAEAIDHQWGYREDLEQENAKNIVITIKQCSPQILTQEL